MALVQLDCKKGGSKLDVAKSPGSAISGSVRITVDTTASKKAVLFALESICQALVEAPWQGVTASGASILDQFVGTSGSGVFAGKKLVAGMDFASATVATAIATDQAPKNPLWSSYCYGGNPPGAYTRNTNQAGLLLYEYDADVGHTGFNDLNGGLPITYDNGAPQQVLALADSSGAGGTRKALRLHACHQSTAEQALLATGNATQVERGAMAHTLASLWWCYPMLVRIRSSIPTGPAGWHPSTWSLQIPGNAYCRDGSEHGIECNGSTYTSAYEDPHTAGSTGINAGTVNIGSTFRDGLPHDWTWEGDASNVLTYTVDGTQVNQLTSTKTLSANPSYAIFTSHIVNGFQGETYSNTAWATAGAAGANLDIFGIQLWAPQQAGMGVCYKPLTPIPDLLCVPGQTISIVLPSTLALWGVASVTDQLLCIPVDQDEPGNSANGWVGAATGAGLPAWLSYNPGTRTISGTVPAVGNGSVNVSGALKLVVGYCPSGNACVPQTFRIVVAPTFTGSTSITLTQGTPQSINLAAGWNMGRDFISGAANKTAARAITASGNPAGMTLGTDGTVSGTPTAATGYTITTTATNNDGQMATATIAVTVQAPAAVIAAPTGITSGTLEARFNFGDVSKQTFDSVITNAIRSIVSDNGTYTLANAGAASTCPTSTTHNGFTVADFLATSSQFLQLATALGMQGKAITVVAIYEAKAGSATHAIADLANSAGGLTINRHALLMSTTGGASFRTCDASGNQSVASVGTSIPTGMHCLIGRKDTGNNAAKFNYDGAGTAVVAGVSAAGPSALNTLSVGKTQETPAATRFANGYLAELQFWSGVTTALSDTDSESIAAQEFTNYGTVNGA